MTPDEPSQRLSRIDTLWTLVRQAHAGPPESAGDALMRLFSRYGGAVHRYLLGSLRDRDAADELFQEFALRVVRGDFRNADPEKGRFRDYLKAAVFRMTVDHRRKSGIPTPAVPDDVPDPDAVVPCERLESEFLAGWREQLLDRTWQALLALERATGQPYYTVLRLRIDCPDLSGEEFRRAVGERLGRAYAPAAARQALHRARERFADLLLDEVRQSLGGAGEDRLEEELADVGLLGYCRSALDRRGRR
jgi:RNA polymerase sigma-70 factor (ECF subfamily)